MIGFFPLLLMILAIPMFYSLTYFILERRRSSSNKSYLRFIALFPIFYVLFFILFYLFNYCIDFIISILYKYGIPENTIVIILELIFLFLIIGFYIFLMKKYFSFNDINLFFIFSAILSFILLNTGDSKGEAHYYSLMMYFLFFTPLCWILFLLNIEVQHRNSEKRKKQSDANPQETDEP